MKKQIFMLLLTIVALSLSACTNGKETEEKDNAKQETVDENANDNDKEELNDERKEEKKDDIDNEEGNEAEEDKKITVQVYMFDPDDEIFVAETKECEELTEQNIWKLLKETSSVPADSNVNTLKVNGDQLELDVDHVFGDQLRSYGTSGEDALMGCVVNTYLDAYKCNAIKITEEGQTLQSGHQEYTEYLTKY